MDKSKVRVLAIDDTPINLHILAKVLDDDLEYFTATSGESGLELAAKIQPDLVLLDVLMPQMDGFEVCRRLKADPTLCHIPVIFVTSAADAISEEEGFALGAVDYISKPINIAVARHRIRNVLDRERLRKATIRDAKEQQRLQTILELSEEKYKKAFYLTPDAMNINRLEDGMYVSVNEGFTRILGYTPEDVLGKTSLSLNIWANPLDRKKLLEGLKRDRVVTNLEAQFRGKDGTLHDALMSASVIHLDNVPHLLSVTRDITERKKADANLRLASSVFTYSHEGIMITSADGTIIDVNNAFTTITGYSRDEVVGNNPRMLSSGRQTPEYYSTMWSSLKGKGHWYGEVWNRRKNGEVYAEMQTVSAVHDEQNNVMHYVSLFSDITSAKAHQAQLEHVAHFDALTSLPNRVLLADRLRQAMTQAIRSAKKLAIVYLDLDGFKSVNDNYGHEVGDQLLVALALRMKLALRDGDTLARIGGDEFVAVLLDLPEVSSSLPMITRLLEAAALPVPVLEHTLQVSASVGITFYPQAENLEADQLLRQADLAMYQAKVAGKNRYHIFDAEQDSNIRGHHESIEHLRSALANREFVLYYQPKVNMRSKQVVGAEALIRWNHPTKGMLAPAMFLPTIEEHSLAVAIGEWVLDEALCEMERWQARGLHLPVSVNVGARQLQEPDFVDRLSHLLSQHPSIDPSSLELEILETSALEDLHKITAIIEACNKLGVAFALDDFGTGYSSLTYLKHLPVSLLKIDQSFVRDMLNQPDDIAILQAVLGLAGAIRREVIAEGVETEGHGLALLDLGCEMAQGYGIARPMPGDQFVEWVHAWSAHPIWS